MRSRSRPSPEELHELLVYDPDTGALTWKPRTGKWSSRWNAAHAGRPAGGITPQGEIALKIYDQTYLAHRVIWAMVHGTWPECVLHRNRKLADNRLANLRDASRKAVQRSLPVYRTNTSGITGVSWNRATGKWVASIRIDDITFYLGSFDRKEDAAIARQAAARRRDRSGL